MHAVGAIRPLISARYALADGADAIRELAERRATGKVVVTVG
jgi:NADPH2:quinone reductase